MAVIGGATAPEKAKLPEALQKSQRGTREQELLNLLQNGSRAEALAAIRELAAIRGRLESAAVYRDHD